MIKLNFFRIKFHFTIFTANPIANYHGQDADNRIVNGTATTIEQHPYQLSFRIENFHICGASILSATRGITTANCAKRREPSSSFTVQAGSTLRAGNSNAQVRRLSHHVVHPKWELNAFSFQYNIALLQWEQPLTFGDNVRAIALPFQNLPVPYGENAISSGWGYVNDEGPVSIFLKSVVQPLISNEECARLYDFPDMPADMVCTETTGIRGSCDGDAGNPLQHNNLLIGLYSWGGTCVRNGKEIPNVFTRVAFFIDWINENL